ncbi:hypothetical protein [Azospirillum argentinense]|uniref:hypothetical protein n=1 Tax=Azospirillum argentinense TaxID=2970906 RepID=UPI0010BF9368|nr:hypothetical protein [Azospirillum argentinense]
MGEIAPYIASAVLLLAVLGPLLHEVESPTMAQRSDLAPVGSTSWHHGLAVWPLELARWYARRRARYSDRTGLGGRARTPVIGGHTGHLPADRLCLCPPPQIRRPEKEGTVNTNDVQRKINCLPLGQEFDVKTLMADDWAAVEKKQGSG